MAKARDTEEYTGHLEDFAETGTDGIIWALSDDAECKEGDTPYDHLHILKNGDLLTIFNDNGKDVLWSGVIKLEYESYRRKSPLNPKHEKQGVCGFWVNGLQENFDPKLWFTYFRNANPAKLVKNYKKPEPL